MSMYDVPPQGLMRTDRGGWRAAQQVRACVVLAEDLRWAPSTYVLVHGCLSLRFLGIQHLFLASLGTVLTWYIYMHADKTHTQNKNI